nr:hypothetical protein Iba_scaffold18461CG0040 [Ipomoea batatas]
MLVFGGQEKATRMIIFERDIELRWLPSRILHVMQIEVCLCLLVIGGIKFICTSGTSSLFPHPFGMEFISTKTCFLTSVFASFRILRGQEKATRMIISERGIELRWLPSRILHVMQVDVCEGEVQPISSTVLNPLLRIYHGRDVTFYASDGPSLLVKVSHDEEDCRVTLLFHGGDFLRVTVLFHGGDFLLSVSLFLCIRTLVFLFSRSMCICTLITEHGLFNRFIRAMTSFLCNCSCWPRES